MIKTNVFIWFMFLSFEICKILSLFILADASREFRYSDFELIRERIPRSSAAGLVSKSNWQTSLQGKILRSSAAESFNFLVLKLKKFQN